MKGFLLRRQRSKKDKVTTTTQTETITSLRTRRDECRDVITTESERKLAYFSYSGDEDIIDEDAPSIALTEECMSRSSGEGGSPSMFCCTVAPSLPPSSYPLSSIDQDECKRGEHLHSLLPPSSMSTPSSSTSSSSSQNRQYKRISIRTDEKSLAPSTTCKTSRPEISPSRTLRELAESLSEFLCAFDNEYFRAQKPQCVNGCCAYCGQCGCLRYCRSDVMSLDGLLICQRVVKKEVEKLRKKLEFEIGHLLGSTSTKASKWLQILRDWLCNFDKSEGKNGGEEQRSGQGHPDALRAILVRNRAHVIHAQQKRIQRLRNDMHFVAETFPPAVTAFGSGQSYLPSTRSMDDSVSRLATVQRTHVRAMSDSIQAPLTSSHPPTGPTQVPRALLRAFSGECAESSSFSTAPHGINEDMFYDSDPGEYRQRYCVPRRASSLKPEFLQEQDTTSEYFESSEEEAPPSGTSSAPFIDETRMSLSSSSEEFQSSHYPKNNEFTFDVNNDELVIQFIRELINDNATLVWHPSQNQNNNNLSPICVQAWFEMGSRLKDKVIQPKFMWRAAYQPDLQRKKLSVSWCQPPDCVELLNIVRVLKPAIVDRDQHPFAKLRNSFTLQSNTNDIFLFECHSERERDRFVQGLKLVVARLASKIIVGDEDVFDEFFTPWGKTISPNGLPDESSSSGDDVSLCESSLDALVEQRVVNPNNMFKASPVLFR